jgi:hypothetical protein
MEARGWQENRPYLPHGLKLFTAVRSTNVVPVVLVRPENSVRQPVHGQEAIAIPADVDSMAHLSEKRLQLLEQRFFAFEMDMEIRKSSVKAAVMQVVEPPAGLEDVAVSAKVITAKGKAVFCLKLRPVFSEPPVERSLREKFRRATDCFHPGSGYREFPTCEQRYGFSAGQMQSQFRHQTTGSEHHSGVDPIESSTQPIPNEGKKFERDCVYRLVSDICTSFTDEAAVGKPEFGKKIEECHCRVPVV